MTLLYVLPEHPSVSQTFVATEAAALSDLGVDVVGYALKRGAARAPAAEVDLLCLPPSAAQLAVSALTSLPAFAAALARDRPVWRSPRQSMRLWLACAHVRRISRKSQGRGVTHIHAHFLGRSSDVANLLSRRIGCRWTATAHGTDVYAPPEPNLMPGRLEHVAAVACANQGVRDRLAELAAPATVTAEVIHCGVDTGALPLGTAAAAPNAPHVVTVGRLVATKGYSTILDAAADLMERHPDLRWTIVGDGPLRAQLEQDRRSARFASRLRFAGSLTHPAALDVVAKATVFVLPCEPGPRGDSDGIPVAIMEAMALGVLVVTTAVGGIAELIVHGETGFLVPPNGSRQLASAVEEMIYSMPPEALDRVRAAARTIIEHDFDLRREAAKLLTLLEPYGVATVSVG